MKATVLMSMQCSWVSQADNELRLKQQADGSGHPANLAMRFPWPQSQIALTHRSCPTTRGGHGLARILADCAPLAALEGSARICLDYPSDLVFRAILNVRAEAAQLPAGLGRTAGGLELPGGLALASSRHRSGQCHATFLANYALEAPARAGGFMAFWSNQLSVCGGI